MPIGLYLPLQPFVGHTHVFLGDALEQIQHKLALVVKSMRVRDQQLAWAADLLAFIPGPPEQQMALHGDIAKATSVTEVIMHLSPWVHQWLTSLAPNRTRRSSADS